MNGTITEWLNTLPAQRERGSLSPILLAAVIINPTGTGNFVGGTTNLDDATVIPNAAYVNVTGAFDTSISL